MIHFFLVWMERGSQRYVSAVGWREEVADLRHSPPWVGSSLGPLTFWWWWWCNPLHIALGLGWLWSLMKIDTMKVLTQWGVVGKLKIIKKGVENKLANITMLLFKLIVRWNMQYWIQFWSLQLKKILCWGTFLNRKDYNVSGSLEKGTWGRTRLRRIKLSMWWINWTEGCSFLSHTIPELGDIQ